MFLRTLTLSAALLALPLTASAAIYNKIDTENSQVEFHYEQMGVEMEGTFTGIDGQILFDTEQPEKAEATITIKMDSADTGSSEADSEIVKKEWFDASSYPDAVFKTKAITRKSDNTFEVVGILSIKGNEKEVHFPATVTEANDKVTFAGDFSIMRGDYAVGEGAWSAFDIVANDIRVDFKLVATQ